MTPQNDAVSLALVFLSLLPYAAAQAEESAASPPPIFNLRHEFNPTMGIVMMVLISAFFSLGLFSVYIRQCIRGGGGGRRTAFGVGEEVIRSFPSFRYSAVKGMNIGKGASLECAVCLNEFEDDETLRLLPMSSHVFHSDCIDAWLSKHITCPVCRSNPVPKPVEDLNFTTVQMLDQDSGSVESDMNRNRHNQDVLLRSPVMNAVSPTNQNNPRGRNSTGLRIDELFTRSHSTGRSMSENWEMFTLRLPEEVSNSTLKRSRSLGVLLPMARSERRGCRSGNSYFQYKRFDRDAPSHWSRCI